MYINPAGDMFDIASDDGFQFAQISGQHRGNAFHLVLTPPLGLSQLATSRVFDATARSKNGLEQFSVSGKAVGHPYSYTAISSSA